MITPEAYATQHIDQQPGWFQERFILGVGRQIGVVALAASAAIAGVGVEVGVPVATAEEIIGCEVPGTICSWGRGDEGSLGNGENGPRSRPKAMTSLDGVTSVAGSVNAGCSNGEGHGGDFAAALRSDGTVWTWGAGACGLMGNGSYAGRAKPEKVPDLQNVQAIATGSTAAYALRSDGTVWAWGNDASGQLGDAAGAPSRIQSRPVKVAGLNDVTAITAGRNTAYALRANGTVWSWGVGSNGELGDGYKGYGKLHFSDTPTQVEELANVKSIAANDSDGYALKTDGTVWAWGQESYGGLGNPIPSSDNPSAPDGSVPVRVKNLENISAIAANPVGAHALALRNDGTVWAWGDGGSGKLGDGIDQWHASSTPTRVVNLSDVSSISSGANNGYAVRNDGTTWSWGEAKDGQLGDGVEDDGRTLSSVPVKVLGLQSPSTIAGSFTHYALNSRPIFLPPPKLKKYVALGDSYSSGEGAPNPGYITGTDLEGNYCHRSTGAYPGVMHGQIKSSYPYFVFRACSGAKIRDFFNRNASNNGEPSQRSWLRGAGLISITLGGNDALFAEVMTYCALRTYEVPSCQKKFSARVSAAIKELSSTDPKKHNTLPYLYSTIKKDAPGAKVLTFAYPRLFPKSPKKSCATGVPSRYFSTSDMKWVNQSIEKMDQAIKVASQHAGFTYVNTYDAFSGHELCTGDSYLNRAIVAPRNSVRKWSFHPKVKGHNKLAQIALHYFS